MTRAAADRSAPPAQRERQTAGPTSRAGTLVSARTFCGLATGRRVRRALADAEHVDGGLTDRVVLELDDSQLIIRAHALPVNGRPARAALLLEVADGPLNPQAADAAALADAMTGATIGRAEVIGHTNTPTPYAVLLVIDNARQIMMEAQALPATSGTPLMTFCAGAACAVGEHGAVDVFDGEGRLVV